MYTCEKQVSVEEMDLDALISVEREQNEEVKNLLQKLVDLDQIQDDSTE
jgi:hypothetical protein